MRLLHLIACLLFAVLLGAQTRTRQNLAEILGFENGESGFSPFGWIADQSNTAFIDDKVVHGGKYSARIERNSASLGTGSTLITQIPLDFAGKTLEWRGFLRTENANGVVAIFLREDGELPNIAFATSQGLGVSGTTGWKEYSITLPVEFEAKKLVFGFFLLGTGKVWADDMRLLVDGKPVADAPDYVPTAIDLDHEFDGDSHIRLTSLSDFQISELAKLAKVWGFLKYHHPSLTNGQRHWDFELFRVLPQILAAEDSIASNALLLNWIVGLGEVAECSNCASLDTSRLHLGTNLEWLGDEALLGAELSQMLRSIHRNRTPAASTFFVSMAPLVGNPVFENEPSYRTIRLPDAGFQLLALFRFWNMVQYFYPYRNGMADDPAQASTYWENVLQESIRGFALAEDSQTYQRELMKFTARINDTHANLFSSLAVLPPVGNCQIPVDVRFVEGRAFVWRHNTASGSAGGPLRPGDIIEELEGLAVEDLVKQWTPMYAASNEPIRLRDLAMNLTRGACGTVEVAITRGNERMQLTANRVPVNTLTVRTSHDRPGTAFQILSSEIAYLKLSSAVAANSPFYIQAAERTKGLIIDIRNSPSQLFAFSLGSLLVSEPTDFVQFNSGDVTNPGAFHWGAKIGLSPAQPHYSGKVVILADEVTQGQAEYTAMAFRAAPGAIVIGSTTAGADGNVSNVPLPGGHRAAISGIGVFYPDKRPTQRVGIIPDVVVKPTIGALANGRDEVIEEAMRQIAASPTQKLTVYKSGGGTLVSEPVGILCDADCTNAAKFLPMGRLVLTASPALGFLGWTGACSGTTPTCVLTLDQPRSVSARFAIAPALRLLTLAPSAVASGSSVTGTVTLTGPAPSGGAVVTLVSSSTATTTAADQVTVPAGQIKASFPVTTRPVATPQQVVITARLASDSNAATLTVIPPPAIATPFSMQFVPIPPGQFIRGSGTDAQLVRITKSIEMGKFEVTQAEFEAVVGGNPSRFIGADLPVEYVTWFDIQDFLSRLNARNDGYRYRLPTEAEWEYAARAGKTQDYSDSELTQFAWFRTNADNRTHRVGTKSPNAWQLYDMLGNVGEVLQDWNGDYIPGQFTDPPGPSFGSLSVGEFFPGVQRGCSFGCIPGLGFRFSNRSASDLLGRYSQVGFRAVRERANSTVPRLIDFGLWDQTARSGDKIIASVGLSEPAGAAGAVVTIESGESPSIKVFANVTIPAGRNSLAFYFQGPLSTLSQQMVLSARSGSDTKTFRLSVTPRPTAGAISTGPFGMQFVAILPGEFSQGCSKFDLDCFLTNTNQNMHDTPLHQVWLTKPFEIGQYEVTQTQWEAVIGSNPSYFRGPDLPVEQVSWQATQEFLSRLNQRKDGYRYRLPTEAEWEYAARAGTTDEHLGGLPAEIAWYAANNGGWTYPGGLKKPNNWGLYDMLGNVGEWVQDWAAAYSSAVFTNPAGPASGLTKLIRGDWTPPGPQIAPVVLANPALALRVSRRAGGHESNFTSRYVGFRCVREKNGN